MGFKQSVTRSDLHFKIISLTAVQKMACRGLMEAGKPLRASLVDNGLDQSANGRTDGLDVRSKRMKRTIHALSLKLL